MFKVGEEYETVCGLKVRIYATDCGGRYPIHGAFYNEGKWFSQDWTEDGSYSSTLGNKSGMDIRAVKPRIKQEVWVNVYERNDVTKTRMFRVFTTKVHADDARYHCWKRVACYKHTIDVEKGEGL